MLRFITCSALIWLVGQPGYSATVSFDYMRTEPSVDQIQSEPTLAGNLIHEFFVTSDADILSVNNVQIAGTLYQHQFGSDTEAPLPVFTVLIPSLSADSWITTPGITSTVGGGFANPDSAWFDTSNDGPVTHFMFARLTSRDFSSFSGRISVGANNTVENFPFLLLIPEPSVAILSGMALLGLIASRRAAVESFRSL